MSMPSCAVCTTRDSLTGVVIAGTQLYLCGTHLEALGDRNASSFIELASFFSLQEMDRRGAPERRRRDRRQFPPRPERRRHNMGRRTTDPES
jgi:hypothetical protein